MQRTRAPRSFRVGKLSRVAREGQNQSNVLVFQAEEMSAEEENSRLISATTTVGKMEPRSDASDAGEIR